MFLVDEADAGAIVFSQRIAITAEDTRAAIAWRLKAKQDAEQRGLTRAVGTDDGMALRDVQA